MTTLIAEPDGDRFHAYCAELTGVHADGDTEEDAFRRIEQAVRAHLRVMERYKRPLPAKLNPNFFRRQTSKFKSHNSQQSGESRQ